MRGVTRTARQIRQGLRMVEAGATLREAGDAVGVPWTTLRYHAAKEAVARPSETRARKRLAVLEALEDGPATVEDAAARAGVCLATAYRAVRRFRRVGCVQPIGRMRVAARGVESTVWGVVP